MPCGRKDSVTSMACAGDGLKMRTSVRQKVPLFPGVTPATGMYMFFADADVTS